MEIFITTNCKDCAHETVCKYANMTNPNINVDDTQLLLDTFNTTVFMGMNVPIYKCIIRCSQYALEDRGSLPRKHNNDDVPISKGGVNGSPC